MSFILDALKKAEAERQRQTGPTLLEVRVTQPRRRFPLWIVVIGALLVINILLLAIFALRRPAAAIAPTAAAAPAIANSSPAPVPAAMPVTTAVSAPAAATVPAALASPALAGNSAGTVPAVGDAAEAPLANPADFTPAVPANLAAAASRPMSDGRREPPSLSDIGGEMPELRLDLHVYAAQPADRYALINMHRVREGDSLPEGPRVIAIDRDGVELSYRGTEFMLRPQ